ncbi:MAG TPA: putative toxin-antitoxin system toxin component, PIN family [Thermoanaerobaculia bacterium]|nr:putative toxin-antitoxin system toxin component, PIN family [Thermoanaerobaculia bacterium]
MRIVLDTNVFISGVFFGGPPSRILEAWRDGLLQLILSPEILDEYQRVGRTLEADYAVAELEPIMALLAVKAEIVEPNALPEPVCSDPDDDKFLACAIAAEVPVIVSGDKHLLRQSGWRGVLVLRPRQFLDEYLPALPD